MDIINKRRSTRTYKSRIVEQHKIEALLKAGMMAPSACNQQPWEFIVVQNKETLLKLSETCPYSKMAKDAPLALVLMVNTDGLKAGEYWPQDMGACSQNILLEAVNLDLGAVWLGVAPLKERMDYISNLFNLTDNLIPFSIIPIGYTENTDVIKVDRYNPDKIHYEKL